MRYRPYKIMLAVFLLGSISTNVAGQNKTVDSRPSKLGSTASLGQALSNEDHHPVHILYIHGIGAQTAGDSLEFRKHLCAALSGCKLTDTLVAVGRRDYADDGDFASDTPPSLRYMGHPVWTGKEDWKASRPFVDHYVLPRSGAPSVVVDEINWWPLVFPLKCRKIMTGESNLAGPNKDLLELCSGQVKSMGQPKPYAFIQPEDAKTSESLPSRAARFNRGVKTSLLDWGFSDAMMAVGPMRDLFREAMRQLFVQSAKFNADGTMTNDWTEHLKEDIRDREFVVVSHSLGSFLVFSTLRDRVFTAQQCAALEDEPNHPEVDTAEAKSKSEDRAACYILARTSIMYFFANQIPLLQLATLTEDLNTQTETWQNLRKRFGQTYITAFGDPSDLLSWQFPEVGDTAVENCHIRNTFWHWLIASPTGAHDNYARNKHVFQIMLHPEIYAARSCSPPH